MSFAYPSYDADFETRRMRESFDFQRQMRQAEEAQRQKNAIAIMKYTLSSMGMDSLYNRVVGYIKDGYDPEAVMVLIRTTPEYKKRFPAMEALVKKGRAISEAEYIDFERTASTLERRYGLPENMLMDSVTELLVNEVSATELNDRVILASAASIQAPDEVKNTFKDYYGIDEGGLTAYFLDPDKATPLLEKQYSTSLIGAEATRQGIGIDVYGAENLQELGITQEEARVGFGRVSRSQTLTRGRGDVVSTEQLISGTFGESDEAARDVERAARARVGRFGGGGAVAGSTRGVTGAGTAETR